MRRTDSILFAPYRSMGVVCAGTRPVLSSHITERRMTSIFCPVDNVVIHYSADKLRLIAISDTFPDTISAITADKKCVYVAHGQQVAVLPTCRHVEKIIPVGANSKFLMVLGENLIIVDDLNGIRIFDIPTQQLNLHLEGAINFTVTAVVHPSTYTNKILLGSSNGTMRLINIRSGRLIYEFSNSFGAAITVLEQSPAVDVVAVGLENGNIILHNVKTNETICSFRHDKNISAVGFRNDGVPLMTTADIGGDIAVWNLEKKELVGKITRVHIGAVTELHFLPGEPIMVSTSADNSIRTWVLDGLDGMPRQLVILEGHAEGISAVQFKGQQEIFSASLDGSVRKHMVNVETMRQKLGSAGIISRKQAKKLHLSIDDIRLEPVIDIALGSSKEAAWDNAICRHKDALVVTTWTTRRNSQGSHKLLHSRFLEDPALCNASATALCLSPCGNFAFIGYSTGHVDQFNVQSGLHMKTFYENHEKTSLMSDSKKKKAGKAHSAAITAISIDARGSELITGCLKGSLKFWNIRKCRCVAKMCTRYKIIKCAACEANSLLAIACEGDEAASVAVIDTLCKRVVRVFNHVGEKVNALTFSSDGRWLLTADNCNYIRVWELSTSQLIDVMLFDKPCIGLSFNSSGEYLATAHKNDKAIYIWASKKMFAAHLNIRALPIDYLPTWESKNDLGMNTFVIDDESDEEMDIMSLKIDSSLVTYSGLAPSRWVNLPILSLIKDRNKPVEAPRKIKQAPFFLTAIPTLEGFDFDLPNEENGSEHRKTLQAKRSMLELESSFSSSLRCASNTDDLICVFNMLKKMSVSAIDFQLRSMPSDVLPNFFKMLVEVLKKREDFELVQSYLATAIRIHRSQLWTNDSDNESLLDILGELLAVEDEIWSSYDQVIVDNSAIVQWVKNALL